MPNAIIAGATGLTGGALLAKLVAAKHYSNIYTLARRQRESIARSHHPLVVDFSSLGVLPDCDEAFCCLGTTIKKAGSQAAFRTVDFDYVLNFANAAKAAGAKTFCVVSALGANPDSAVFYNRVKGEMEQALTKIGFDSLHIFQPSLLLGDRAESRLGERIGIGAFAAIAPLLIGRARKYRPIAADDVAEAMIKMASRDSTANHAVFRYESDEIVLLARR